MGEKSLLWRLLYRARDLRSRELYRTLRQECRGNVLDVGGWDFVYTAQRQGVKFERWTTLERFFERLPPYDPAARIRVVCGDALALPFADDSQDTVLCIQVLEHIFEPITAVEEIGRVLRPGGKAIIMVPATSTMHLAPHFHQNVSRFWVRKAMERAGLEVESLQAIGGVWSTFASRLLYFFLQAVRTEGMTDPEIRRNWLFWVLLPFQVIFALIAIPICLLFSLGDLAEEPNNYLAVGRKPNVGQEVLKSATDAVARAGAGS
jgi:SAM-dependent methyltransferase